MNKLVWTLQVVLVLAMALFGLQKVFLPIPDLIDFGMLWIEDFPAWQVRTIGALEALGAIGLVLPYLIKALPRILVPLAAGGLALTMVGAIVTHVSRNDPATSIVITSALFGMGILVSVMRARELRAGAGVAEQPEHDVVPAS